MTVIDINRDEAGALHYALRQHIRHLDELLGRNFMWPSERRRMMSLMQRLYRIAAPQISIEDIDECVIVYEDAASLSDIHGERDGE